MSELVVALSDQLRSACPGYEIEAIQDAIFIKTYCPDEYAFIRVLPDGVVFVSSRLTRWFDYEDPALLDRLVAATRC